MALDHHLIGVGTVHSLIHTLCLDFFSQDNVLELITSSNSGASTCVVTIVVPVVLGELLSVQNL